MTKAQRASLLLGLAVALPLAFAGMAWAGGASLDEDEEDDSQAGVSFFGFAKDLDRGGVVADAKVSAEIKNRNASLVTRTDAQGHFKFSGFNKDIDPKDVEITCTKEGFKLQRTLRLPGRPSCARTLWAAHPGDWLRARRAGFRQRGGARNRDCRPHAAQDQGHIGAADLDRMVDQHAGHARAEAPADRVHELPHAR